MKNRFVLIPISVVLILLANTLLTAQINPGIQIIGPTTACTGCYSYEVTVDSNIINAAVISYEWNILPPNGGALITMYGPNPFICFQTTGNYRINLTIFLADGSITGGTINVSVLPYLPIEIVSNNIAACHTDSTSTDPNNQFCEKVCPYTTVTYSLLNLPFTGSPNNPSYDIIWSVTGAQGFTVNSPNNTSVTVTWGPAGAGSVSVVVKSLSSPGTQGCNGEAAVCVTIVEEPRAAFSADPAPAALDTVRVCKGQTVWFENQSQYADAYEWLFSDDQSEYSDVNTQHTFFTAGLYTVRLIARSACLCADTTEMTVEVIDVEAPSLDCVGDVCPGATVSYTASANCTGIDWAVSANGTVLQGGTPGADSITVTWGAGPLGAITLSNYACNGQVCPFPTLVRVPIIDDNAQIRGPERVCPDAEEIYSIDPFGGTDFVWTLSGGGSIVEGQGSNRVSIRWISFPTPNTTYWLTVRYDNCYLGCGGIDSIPVRVVSPFFIEGPVELCPGATGDFSARLSANNQDIACDWMLRGPDGSTAWSSPAATANATVSFAAGAGLYRLLAVPADPAQSCTERAEWTIRVPDQPAPPTGIDGPGLICPGQAYAYEAAGVLPGATIRWEIQNGPGAPLTDSGNPINIVWNATGPYLLTAVQLSQDGLGCLSAPVQRFFQVLGALNLNGPAERCTGSTATYSAPLIEGTEYQWSLMPADAGTIVSGQGGHQIEIYWQTPGNHQVRLDVCNLSASQAVVVHALPAPMVNAPTGLCPGDAATVQTTGAFATHRWIPAAGGSPLSATATADLGPGDYAVEVTDNNGCAGSLAFSIQAYPTPIVTVSTADPTAFCNNSRQVTMRALVGSGGGITYEWFRDGAPLGVNAPVYTTNQYGQYTVQATNASGCTAIAGPVSIVEDCSGGGGGGFPCVPRPPCPPGSVTLQIDPSPRCDSMQFTLTGPDLVPGSGSWAFVQSGGLSFGTPAGDQVRFVFPEPGYFIVAAYAELTDGTLCRILDSVTVEAVADFTALPECPGSATGFNDNSAFLPASGITAWIWDFGDPASGVANTSSAQNPDHIYANGGIYPVTLTITAGSGCTSAATAAILIPQPAAPVITPPAGACAGNALEFTATGPGLTWDFGDPGSGVLNTASGKPVYHLFPPGSYTVSATVTDNYGCTASDALTVNVAPNALSGVISPANPAPLCEGQTITLTAPSGGQFYRWSDSSTADTLTVGQEGLYRVTLTDADGCTYSPPAVAVDIVPGPDALIKALLTNEQGQVVGTSYPALSVCAGEDVYLIAQGPGNYTYTWSTGRVTANEEFSVRRNNLLNIGTHVFTVTVTDITTGCTAVTDPFVVTVNPRPAGFSVANNIFPPCAGLVNTLSYSGPNPGNWQFVWNNGSTDLPLVTENPGRYFLRVINEFGCEAVSNTLTILPGPNVAAVPAGCHTRCRPDTLCLPNIPNIASWQWYFNGNPIPGATGPALVAGQSGTYYAALTDFSGCPGQSGPLTLNLLDGYGTILGQVWSDVNQNGIIDGPDTLVSGIPVNLIQNGNPVGSGLSGPTGDFGFANILSTGYTVEVDTGLLPAGWQIVIGQENATLSGCNAQDQVALLLEPLCVNALTTTVNLEACPGATALYNGTPISAGDSQTFLFASVDGCDSLVTVNVGTLPVSTGTLDVSACAGSAYDYNGTLIAAGSSQQFVLQNALGCDSVLTVNVGTLPVSTGTLDVSACAGSVYDYNGTLIAAGSSQQFVLQNALGCDSVLTVNVGTLPVSTGTLDVSACAGSAYDYNGTLIAAGSSQQFVLQNALGCDSVLTVNVGTLPVSTGTLDVSACAGSVYDYNGTLIAAGSSQQFVLQNALGCDSVLTVNVGTLPVSTGTLDVSACPGSAYDYNGTLIAAGSSQQFVLQNALGCDSVLTVNVGTLPASTGTLDVSACPGSAYDYNGTLIAAGSSQQFVLQNALGCDSVLTVNVGTLPVSTGTLDVSACPGSAYDYNGTLIAAGSSQQFVLQNALGCDSVLTVNVGTLPVSTGTLDVSACPGSAYDYNGTLIAAGSSQQFVLQNALGCDSVLTVNVGTLPVSTGTLDVSACAGSAYDYNGTLIAAGSSQQFVLQNTLGCDSVLTVNVGISPTSASSLNFRLCPGDSVSYQGIVLQIGDIQPFTLQNAAGCDSVVTVSVSAVSTTSETIQVEVCPGETYTFDGVQLQAGQTQVFQYINAEGCDSTITVTVLAFPAATFDLNGMPSCPNSATGSLTVINPSGGQPPYRYSLDGSAFQDETLFNNLESGTYTVWLEDSNACLFEETVDIQARAPLELFLDDAELPCDSAGIQLLPIVNGDQTDLTFQWSTGQQTPALTVYDPGVYVLQISNICETIQRDVRVNWADAGASASLVYVPNVFAPASNHPDNAYFRPHFAPDLQLLNYKLEVFDRWGNLMFRAQDPQEGWAGPFRDKAMQPAVFVWYLSVDIDYCGRVRQVRREGDVTIVR